MLLLLLLSLKTMNIFSVQNTHLIIMLLTPVHLIHFTVKEI